MNYKQIVFDIDGTMLDTAGAILIGMQETLVELTGSTPPQEELLFALGCTGVAAAERMGLDPDVMLPMWEERMHEHFDTVRLFDGIPEALKALSAAGYGLGIVTSETKWEYELSFVPYGAAGYFQTVVLADDTPEHKPHAAPLLKLMERTGCRPEEVLYIGDSEYDIQCAANAGVDFALAGWGCRQRLDAPRVFAHPSDILKYLSA